MQVSVHQAHGLTAGCVTHCAPQPSGLVVQLSRCKQAEVWHACDPGMHVNIQRVCTYSASHVVGEEQLHQGGEPAQAGRQLAELVGFQAQAIQCRKLTQLSWQARQLVGHQVEESAEHAVLEMDVSSRSTPSSVLPKALQAG